MITEVLNEWLWHLLGLILREQLKCFTFRPWNLFGLLYVKHFLTGFLYSTIHFNTEYKPGYTNVDLWQAIVNRYIRDWQLCIAQLFPSDSSHLSSRQVFFFYTIRSIDYSKLSQQNSFQNRNLNLRDRHSGVLKHCSYSPTWQDWSLPATQLGTTQTTQSGVTILTQRCDINHTARCNTNTT